jgi:hypothetical protein
MDYLRLSRNEFFFDRGIWLLDFENGIYKVESGDSIIVRKFGVAIKIVFI